MGMTLGLVGAGGSILTTPILVYLFHIPILKATTYSIVIVGMTAFLATLRSKDKILFSRAILFTISSVSGVFVARHYVFPNLPKILWDIKIDLLLIILLLIFMAIASFFMIRNIKFTKKHANNNSILKQIQIFTVAISLGLIMGTLGAGGGFLIIPTLVLLMSFTMAEAVPTSLFIISTNSLVGFLADKHDLSYQDIKNLISFLILAAIGMLGGVFLNKHIKGSSLKKIFGWFVLLIACLIFHFLFLIVATCCVF